MTTYKEAAQQAYSGVLKLWNNGHGFDGQTDAFWLRGNTLRTVITYMNAASPTEAAPFINTALGLFEETVPSGATDKDLESIFNAGIWLDDFGWWAIGFLSAYDWRVRLGLDSTTAARLLTGATHCCKIMSLGWDKSSVGPVQGGVWNKQGQSKLMGRNCVTNRSSG